LQEGSMIAEKAGRAYSRAGDGRLISQSANGQITPIR
jgi:hypothetical protein